MKEPLFKISYRLLKMPPGDRGAYLIACIKAERPDSVRRRELSHQLVDARTAQIRQEVKIATNRRK